MPCLLGVDVSTTGVKALLIDERGSVLSAVTTPHELSTPRPLWSEQNPEDWWSGTSASIREALREAGISPEEILGIGLTGQMHGLTLLGKRSSILRPAILWNDQRTGSQCDRIRHDLGFERLIAITGNDALTGFTLPKLLWVAEKEPRLYAKIEHVLLPKDYVRLRLTGDYATDRAGASGTSMLDIRSRDWSDDVLSAFSIPRRWLPKTHEGPEITGVVSDDAAVATGLTPNTPVVAGAGDQAAQAVGVGAVAPGIVALTLGTSGVVFASTDEAVVEPHGRLHAYCHAVPGRWHVMGVMLSAGGSLRWLRDTFFPDISFAELTEGVDDVPIGGEGLLFLPYLTGERTPHADPLARGAFVGLTVRHERKQVVRAVLEGVGFALRDGFELLRSVGLREADEVRASGGGMESVVWREILAEVLGVSLYAVNATEGAALGAALLAGVGVGAWESVDAACRQVVRTTDCTSPTRQANGSYNEIYKLYRSLYPSLKELSHHLCRWEQAQHVPTVESPL